MVDAVKILGSLLASGVLSRGSGGNVLGNVLGAALGGGQQSGGGLASVLGSVLGGGQGQGNSPLASVLGSLLGGGQQQAPAGGGLGGMLGSVLGGGQQQAGGGLGGMLGSALGGGQRPQAPQGGMGDLLGSLLGAAGGGQGQAGGLGSLLTGALAKYAQTMGGAAAAPAAGMVPAGLDTAQAEEQANLVIRAMINAAKSDGKIDKAESERIIGKLGDLDPEEVNFLRREMSAPLDVDAFVASVPRGMEQQIYAMSLMAIDLDTQQEANYLHQLAQGLRLNASVCNQIHEQLGAPKIFA